MNTKFIASSLIAVAALASSAAFADEVNTPRTAPVVSQFSSAEVQANYFKAAKEGTLPVLADAAAAKTIMINSGVTRTEIKAQAVQWAHAKNMSASAYM